LPTQIFINAATIVLPFRQHMFVVSLSAGRWPVVIKVIAFQAKVSRWIEKFDRDGYFCIRGCFWLEKPNFHKELQVINFELRMRSSALFQSATIYVNLSIFFSQINADLFLADSRWFIFCAHLRFQSANICVNCFSKFSHPRPNILQNYSLLKIRGVPPKAGRGYCLSGKG
jgi:hypothetical protein